MKAARFFRHLFASHWRTRRKFPRATLEAIEAAITRAESAHCGEIRFAVETSLPLDLVWRDVSPRQHAQQVFTHLRVWDTEHNNGVLVYLELADRDVEIVADRGLAARVGAAEWENVCRLMEEHFRAGRFEEGSIAGIEAVGSLLARNFPATARGTNDLPDRPVLL